MWPSATVELHSMKCLLLQSLGVFLLFLCLDFFFIVELYMKWHTLFFLFPPLPSGTYKTRCYTTRSQHVRIVPGFTFWPTTLCLRWEHICCPNIYRGCWWWQVYEVALYLSAEGLESREGLLSTQSILPSGLYFYTYSIYRSLHPCTPCLCPRFYFLKTSSECSVSLAWESKSLPERQPRKCHVYKILTLSFPTGISN